MLGNSSVIHLATLVIKKSKYTYWLILTPLGIQKTFLAITGHGSPHHHRVRTLHPVDIPEGWINGGSILGQNPVVLVVEDTGHWEQLLIQLDNNHIWIFGEPLEQRPQSGQPLLLGKSGKELELS